MKRNAQMPNKDLEDLMSKLSRKITEGVNGEILTTKLDFDYDYGQSKLDEKTRSFCIFTITGGEFTGYYRFLKRFYGLADNPTIGQERIEKTLEYKHPALFDYIIIVTRGDVKKHEAENRETMKKTRKRWIQTKPNEMRTV